MVAAFGLLLPLDGYDLLQKHGARSVAHAAPRTGMPAPPPFPHTPPAFTPIYTHTRTQPHLTRTRTLPHTPYQATRPRACHTWASPWRELAHSDGGGKTLTFVWWRET